ISSSSGSAKDRNAKATFGSLILHIILGTRQSRIICGSGRQASGTPTSTSSIEFRKYLGIHLSHDMGRITATRRGWNCRTAEYSSWTTRIEGIPFQPHTYTELISR